MTNALKADAIQRALAVARATVGACESPPNSNRGPFVERCQGVTGNKPGDPWCASWLAMTGATALGTAWPLPATGGCQVLADFAKKKKILMQVPVVGDVFLVWHPSLGRFGHTGFVTGPTTGDTIAGNTSGAGSRDGWLVWPHTFAWKPEDRFIRWTDLLVP